MRTLDTRKTVVIAASAAALLALAGCKPAPDPAGKAAADGAIEGDAESTAEGDVTDAPNAQPTASIFGPEAGLPEPEDDAEAALEPLKATIGFPDGGAELDADAVAALEKALGSDQLRGAGLITLRAHSDASGDMAANTNASQERGLAVAAWLIERGISEEAIAVIAFGAQNPAQPNAKRDGSPNELGRAANRRVELEAGTGKTMPKLPEKDAEAK
ncbi:MAG: OmpA family protein [Marinomonas sp.]